MVFSAPLFLLGFLPIVLALYAIAPARLLNLTALVASIFFYAWGEPIFVLFVVASAGLDLVIVRLMVAAGRPFTRRLLVGIGVAGNLGLLAYFKYAWPAPASARARAWWRRSIASRAATSASSPSVQPDGMPRPRALTQTWRACSISGGLPLTTLRPLPIRAAAQRQPDAACA